MDLRKVKEYLSRNRIETEVSGTFIRIPVCYESDYGTDLNFIAMQNKISVEKIIHLHVLTTYRVYMLGFLPGFRLYGHGRRENCYTT
jgi:inhibitor of KinA